MDAKIELVTPTQAKRYLAQNVDNNRPIHQKWVDDIIDLMDSDEWLLNGESLKFMAPNKDGHELLIDGQHRLSAIIRRNKPVQMLIVRGLPEKVFQTVDAGKKRTAGDVLAIAGYKSGALLAAAARLLIMFETDHTFAMNYKRTPSVYIMRMVERFPDLVDSVKYGAKIKYFLPPTQVVFMHFLLKQQDEEKAADFCLKLAEGTSMEKGDPILSFRERMFRYRAANVRLPRSFSMGFMIKAWNYWKAGTAIQKFRFAKDEMFPLINGFDRKALFGSDYPSEILKEHDLLKRRNAEKQQNLFEGEQATA